MNKHYILQNFVLFSIFYWFTHSYLFLVNPIRETIITMASVVYGSSNMTTGESQKDSKLQKDIGSLTSDVYRQMFDTSESFKEHKL